LRGRRHGKFAQADWPRIEHHSICINLRLRIAALTARNVFEAQHVHGKSANMRAQSKTGG
jgi:hypothetical protein